MSTLIASVFAVVALVCISIGHARPKGDQTVVGYVSDSMCGLDHLAMKMGPDKECTTKCVEAGSKFVVADRVKKIVYALDDAGQAKAREFAGQKVKVTGEVDAKDKSIKVKMIEEAK